MYTNFKEKPYFLSDDDINWVEETIDDMTIEEKIGQLFIALAKSTDEKYIENLVDKYHLGGARFVERDPVKILKQNRLFQKTSNIPMFIAANCEDGGSSLCDNGTQVATQAQTGATLDANASYEMGRIGGIEAAALNCNWTFSPIVDILFNWRNTIVNTRSFSNEAEQVLDLARANIKGLKNSNILTSAKHFPGDGVDERDHHLLMAVNDLSCEEWDESFGKVYKSLIDDGLETVMIGHIALPEYSKKLRPGIREEDILPATLAPEITTDLLRKKLGFQGLVITDASHMGGLLSAMPRSEQLPRAIAAGCDMFLFMHDEEEDFNYMLEGYKNGIITDQRLQEALEHILGMKAKLGLHKAEEKSLEESLENLEVIGSEEHIRIAEEIANESITLVKDTQDLLPIDVSEKKRAKLYFIESAPLSYEAGLDPTKKIVIEQLERVGFEVDVNESLYDLELKQPSPFNKFKIMDMPTVESFKEQYDVVFVFVHMKGYAQENNVRFKYSAPHSNELPWWVREVPTVCVSLNYTNHLYDLPMMKTFINAYGPTQACIKATVEKIVGESDFKGQYNENVWCGRWDTKY